MAAARLQSGSAVISSAPSLSNDPRLRTPLRANYIHLRVRPGGINPKALACSVSGISPKVEYTASSISKATVDR